MLKKNAIERFYIHEKVCFIYSKIFNDEKYLLAPVTTQITNSKFKRHLALVLAIIDHCDGDINESEGDHAAAAPAVDGGHQRGRRSVVASYNL